MSHCAEKAFIIFCDLPGKVIIDYVRIYVKETTGYSQNMKSGGPRKISPYCAVDCAEKDFLVKNVYYAKFVINNSFLGISSC